MHRSLLAAAVIVLALLAAALSWFSRIQAADNDVPELEPAAVEHARIEIAQDPLERPNPPEVLAAPAALMMAGLDEQDRRRPAALPAPPDFALTYAQWPRDQLPKRFVELEERIHLVRSACFDQLHAQFDALYAAGEHGARVTEPGKAFEQIEFRIDSPRDYSARTVERPDGSFVMHVLEITPSEEPALAQLVAEREWVRGRIRGVH